MAEYPHLYVKARRKKKHGTSRSHRRRTRQALQANDGANDYAEIDSIDRKDDTMYYDQTAPLRTALQYKVQRRARTEAINQYRKPDAAEKVEMYFQDRLKRTQQNALTREVATVYDVLLHGQPIDGSARPWHLNTYYQAWLMSFLELHPEWRCKIENWSAKVLTD